MTMILINRNTAWGRLKSRLTIVFAVVTACIVLPVQAQQAERRFPTPAEPRPTPPLQPPTEPPASLPPITVVPPSLVAPPGAEQARFVLRELVIKGATVYSSDVLRAYYANLMGKETSVAQLYEIARQIQQKYRDDGYFLARVTVPPQKVRNGIFELQVIEGYISQVRIEGEVGWVKPRIQAYLDRIIDIRPVKEQDVDRYLLLINDIPGVRAFGVLQRSQEGVGGSELVVRVERDPVDVAVAANNRGSKYTGPRRAGISLQENAATLLGERVGVFLFATEDHEQRFGQLSYEQLLGSDGMKLLASASIGPAEPGYNLNDLDTETESRAAQLGLSYPLLRSRDRNLYLQGGFEAIRSTIDMRHERFSENQLRVLYLETTYDFRDQLLSDRLEGQSSFGLGLRRGLGILGASDSNDPDLAPPGGSPTFTSLQLQASRYQPLIGPFGLFVDGNGQYAFDTLLQDETYCVGGEPYGRGYVPCELAGDSGLGLTAEARYTDTRMLGPVKGTYQLYGFYDFGVIWHKQWQKQDYPEQRQSLGSTGLGVRTSLWENLFADFEVAWPFTRSPSERDNRDPRFYFQLSARY